MIDKLSQAGFFTVKGFGVSRYGIGNTSYPKPGRIENIIAEYIVSLGSARTDSSWYRLGNMLSQDRIGEEKILLSMQGHW